MGFIWGLLFVMGVLASIAFGLVVAIISILFTAFIFINAVKFIWATVIYPAVDINFYDPSKVEATGMLSFALVSFAFAYLLGFNFWIILISPLISFFFFVLFFGVLFKLYLFFNSSKSLKHQ